MHFACATRRYFDVLRGRSQVNYLGNYWYFCELVSLTNFRTANAQLMEPS